MRNSRTEIIHREELTLDLMSDPDELDVECIRQPDAFFKWAERLVNARAIADLRERQLDAVEASLQYQCRRDPESFGLNVTTEAAIKAVIHIHPDYNDAVERFLKATEHANWLRNAVSAMEMKNSDLDKLVRLHGQEYFAGPNIPHNLAKAYQTRQARIAKTGEARQASKVRRTDGK
jgi:predicted nucleotide-binding protein (sugar kinase/HSP70/actin superfamily)